LQQIFRIHWIMLLDLLVVSHSFLLCAAVRMLHIGSTCTHSGVSSHTLASTKPHPAVEILTRKRLCPTQRKSQSKVAKNLLH